jgi:ribose 5-phosphate isomerase B
MIVKILIFKVFIFRKVIFEEKLWLISEYCCINLFFQIDFMKIVIGCDHAGFELKNTILTYFNDNDIEWVDIGTFSKDSMDYPDIAHPVAELVEKREFDFGVLICGSANGVAISANKHKNIRAAICWNNEIASLARQHNNANIICLPARFVTIEAAIEMTDVFLSTPFEGGRHQTRVEKI